MVTLVQSVKAIASVGAIVTVLTWRARRLIYEVVGLESLNRQSRAGAAFESLAESPYRDPLAEFHLNRIRSDESGTTVVVTKT